MSIILGGPSKTPTTTIYSDLASLLLVKEFSDITLTGRDDVAFPAHKVVVFHRCPELRARFGDDASKIKLDEVGKESLYKLLEFFYTDFTYVEEESPEASELRAFSEKYALPKLANLAGDLKGTLPFPLSSFCSLSLSSRPNFCRELSVEFYYGNETSVEERELSRRYHLDWRSCVNKCQQSYFGS